MDGADATPSWAKAGPGEKDKDGGARERQMFLRKTDLKELEIPIVRKAMRHPEHYYLYNATEDRCTHPAPQRLNTKPQVLLPELGGSRGFGSRSLAQGAGGSSTNKVRVWPKPRP